MTSRIRLATAADASEIACIYAPFCSETAISFEDSAPPADEMAQRVQQILQRLPWLVFAGDDAVLGYAYASRHRERSAYRWSVDVTVYVAPQARRTGVGRRLYLSLFEILAMMGYHRAYAGVTLPNPASEGLHTALGFTPVGSYRRVGFKLGRWHDVRWFERALRDDDDAPQEPLLLPQVVSRPEFAMAIEAQ